jgi:hypothetical protein
LYCVAPTSRLWFEDVKAIAEHYLPAMEKLHEFFIEESAK